MYVMTSVTMREGHHMYVVTGHHRSSHVCGDRSPPVITLCGDGHHRSSHVWTALNMQLCEEAPTE